MIDLTKLKTAEQKAAESIAAKAIEVRTERNRLLAESDSMVLPDRWEALTAEQKAAWTAYRQELRDLTAQSGFPSSVVWPVSPATQTETNAG